jgi:hypothetical protein
MGRSSSTPATTGVSAAAVAICSATAATSEAPQVRWTDHQTEGTVTIALAGRGMRPGMAEQEIAPRTVELDAWQAEALALLAPGEDHPHSGEPGWIHALRR